ncbi:putative bifunctional diguanylate cyclase/phosphodiesterase [Undibacterium sp. RuRC25W]|uniref:putative bifunctional diguanylate cyclase/phosphodiesterase n=1 Tax=Undibacterium sp. RuRC25W TaxID=3413047 RepID=UPI003BF17070
MSYSVLIASDKEADIQALMSALKTATSEHYQIESVTKLSTALIFLEQHHVDVILLNLSLPDSEGVNSFVRLSERFPYVPILILIDEEKNIIDFSSANADLSGIAGYLLRPTFSSLLVTQTIKNIIQHQLRESSNFVEKTRAEIILNSIGDAVVGTDLFGNIDYFNVAAEQLTLWARNLARGRAIMDVMPIINGETRKVIRNPINLVLETGCPGSLPVGSIMIRADGTELNIEDSTAPVHDVSGALVGAVMVFHDVTVTQAMSAKMAYFAKHDFLTSLPNRILLNDRISQAINLANRRHTHLAILFLDLDHFKYINDSLGHAVGDLLLQSVTERLCACVRNSDTVSRQGGDEFIILINEDLSGENASLTAVKILHALAIAQNVGEHVLHVTTSIGISIYPNDGENAETLIKNADTAMYQAKDKGRNNYQFFKKEMNDRAVERQLIESQLRQAISKKEFLLLYQPKICLATGVITGVEALLRWNHPQWGDIKPSRFITIAEDSGLIVEIGRWVLREACQQMKRWNDAGVALDNVAVNISALEFRRLDFASTVSDILLEFGLAGKYLQLEITESVLMRDVDLSADILRTLKKMGIQIAVDDFGTGYSSLSYLKKFPIDVLKIDQSFVRDIGSSGEDSAIVSAIIAMGNSLNYLVVAEGVEELVQEEFLKKLHCKEAQGYFFGCPMDAQSVADLVAHRTDFS